MAHFFFYGLSVFLFTVAVFMAGMYVGEKVEKAFSNSQE